MLSFSSNYKASLQTSLNAHMSGVTKTVMNTPCTDCQTGKNVSRVLSDLKGGQTGYQNRRGGSNNRGRGRFNNRRNGRSNNDRYNGRSRGRGRSFSRGGNRDQSRRNDNTSANNHNNTSAPSTGGTGKFSLTCYD